MTSIVDGPARAEASPKLPADGRIFHALSRWLLWPVAALVTVVITFSFLLSFQAQVELAMAARIPAAVAWGWPVIVDGTVVIATASALILQPRGPRVSWYPWAILVVFGSLSISVNALHALAAEPATWILTIISATPAVSLLVSTHLLTTLLGHGGSSTAPPAVTDPLPRADPAEIAHPAVVSAIRSISKPETGSARPSIGTSTSSAPVDRRSAPKPLARTLKPATREEIEFLLDGGSLLTGADVGERMRLSPARGQKILDQILADRAAGSVENETSPEEGTA